MSTCPDKIAMNGVTGRMGRNQHRSIVAIRAEAGEVELPGGERVMPDLRSWRERRRVDLTEAAR